MVAIAATLTLIIYEIKRWQDVIAFSKLFSKTFLEHISILIIGCMNTSLKDLNSYAIVKDLNLF